jgi:hypothetical protein
MNIPVITAAPRLQWMVKSNWMGETAARNIANRLAKLC